MSPLPIYVLNRALIQWFPSSDASVAHELGSRYLMAAAVEAVMAAAVVVAEEAVEVAADMVDVIRGTAAGIGRVLDPGHYPSAQTRPTDLIGDLMFAN